MRQILSLSVKGCFLIYSTQRFASHSMYQRVLSVASDYKGKASENLSDY